MQKPLWIIFDVGGVLYDYLSSFKAIADYLNIEENQIWDVINSQIGKEERGSISLEEVWTKILAPMGRESELRSVIELWYDPRFWLAETIQLMSDFKLAGYHLAIMTNNWRNMTARLMAVPGMSVAEKLYESSVIGMRKPDLEFYDYIQTDLGVESSQIMLIDDNPDNIDAAKISGWQGFLYAIGDDSGISSSKMLRQLIFESNHPDIG